MTAKEAAAKTDDKALTHARSGLATMLRLIETVVNNPERLDRQVRVNTYLAPGVKLELEKLGYTVKTTTDYDGDSVTHITW